MKNPKLRILRSCGDAKVWHKIDPLGSQGFERKILSDIFVVSSLSQHASPELSVKIQPAKRCCIERDSDYEGYPEMDWYSSLFHFYSLILCCRCWRTRSCVSGADWKCTVYTVLFIFISSSDAPWWSCLFACQRSDDGCVLVLLIILSLQCSVVFEVWAFLLESALFVPNCSCREFRDVLAHPFCSLFIGRTELTYEACMEKESPRGTIRSVLLAWLDLVVLLQFLRLLCIHRRYSSCWSIGKSSLLCCLDLYFATLRLLQVMIPLFSTVPHCPSVMSSCGVFSAHVYTVTHNPERTSQ